MNLIFNPKKAEKHPVGIFILGFIYSSISLLFALFVFPDYTSIAMIFLTVFSCLYLIQSAYKIEEENDQNYKPEKIILKEHSHLIKMILCLFLGFTISFSLWAFILPVEKTSMIFEVQNSVVENIRAKAATGGFSLDGPFGVILFNNFRVLAVSLIFALFFGAGAIYILVWNASVMGFVIGNLAKDTFGIFAMPIAFTKYFIHGIPEMLSYLIASLAGGLLYIAFWKGDFKNPNKRKRLLFDSFLLIFISVIILILAAFIEIYISKNL